MFRGYALHKTFFLAALVVLGFTHSSAASAQELPPIRRVVSFGDSLSDAGTYWFRFTTNPGLTFAQHLALHYGQMPFPNQHLDRYDEAFQGNHGDSGPGGLNYAEGGAKADSAYSSVSQDPEGKPISARQQLNHGWTARCALGYGLKYATGFGDTHLGRKGRMGLPTAQPR
jgi:phospholipase/lecithinase/hemolysin